MNSLQLLQKCGITIQGDSPESFEIVDIVCDSSQCAPGVIFVAMRGTKHDGHDYIEEALHKGASMVLGDAAERRITDPRMLVIENSRKCYGLLHHCWRGKPSENIQVLGITGTNGKTSTAFLTQHFLNQKNQTALLGSIHNSLGKEQTPSTHTTETPAFLHEFFDSMRRNKVSQVVMEVSSHALVQDRLSGITLSHALFTNLSQDHLDYHVSMENYYAAKKKILTYVAPQGYVLVNADERVFDDIPKSCSNRILRYGFHVAADFRADVLEQTATGMRFVLIFQGREYVIETDLIGHHNVLNILASIALAWSMGQPVAESIQALKTFPGIPGRLQNIHNDLGFKLYVDYAHTPDGLKASLNAIRPLVQRRLLLLFGCGGDRDQAKRPLMGQVANELADEVVLTTDNPRHENPRRIVEHIREGCVDRHAHIEVQLDRTKAIRHILLKAREGDAILLAGKGHENYQVVGDNVIPFNDKEECQRILKGL